MVIDEQNGHRAMAFCDRTYIARLGGVVMESSESELSDVALKTAYFGA